MSYFEIDKLGWKRRWNSLAAELEGFPLLGGLLRCQLSDHLAALKEFSINVVFATATFWLTAVLLRYRKDGPADWSDAFYQTFMNGELFIFCVSLLGPIFYVALEEPSWAKQQFPGKTWHATLVALLALLCAALFAATRVSNNMNLEDLVVLSIYLALAACGFRYITIVYNKLRMSPIDRRQESTRDFTNRLKEHREEGGKHE